MYSEALIQFLGPITFPDTLHINNVFLIVCYCDVVFTGVVCLVKVEFAADCVGLILYFGTGQSRLNPCIFAGRNTLWGVKWTISQRRRRKAADTALESRRDDGSVSARLGLCVINCTENTRPGALKHVLGRVEEAAETLFALLCSVPQ